MIIRYGVSGILAIGCGAFLCLLLEGGNRSLVLKEIHILKCLVVLTFLPFRCRLAVSCKNSPESLIEDKIRDLCWPFAQTCD